jgi:RNA:NAD 2'-phosphotransferase (TPT1/KptA family)
MDAQRMTRISKTMSFLLRHGAQKEGLPIQPNGFVPISDLLAHRNLRSLAVTRVNVLEVVAQDAKGRYELDASQQLIRATQGHSMKLESVEDDMTPLTVDSVPLVVVHGTYRKFLASIEQEGLKRFSRQHIHMTTGTHGDESVKSGMRNNVDTYIFIDARRAIADGIPFFLSRNGVVLTPGIGEQGILPAKYFLRVEHRSKSSTTS